jgi:hypothetical protein
MIDWCKCFDDKEQNSKKIGLEDEKQPYYKHPHFELKFENIIINSDLLVRASNLWKLFKQNGEWLNIVLSNVLGTME